MRMIEEVEDGGWMRRRMMLMMRMLLVCSIDDACGDDDALCNTSIEAHILCSIWYNNIYMVQI